MANKHSKQLSLECALCGYSIPVGLEKHRIKPGYAGGQYTLENTVYLCANCHKVITRVTGKIQEQAPRFKDLKKVHAILGKYLKVIKHGEKNSVTGAPLVATGPIDRKVA